MMANFHGPAPLRWTGAFNFVGNWITMVVGLPMALVVLTSPWFMDAAFLASDAWLQSKLFFQHAAAFSMAFILIHTTSKEAGQMHRTPMRLLMCFVRCMVVTFLVLSALALMGWPS